MIAILRGEVASVTLQTAVVLVGGIGFEVYAPAPALASLRVGSEAVLHTSMVVREDSMTLYGFPDKDSKDAFEIITSVTGVGPKLGLAVLSVHDAEALRAAVANEDKAALQSVPGIGPKSAARMLLELKDKLRAVPGSAPLAGGSASAAEAGVRPQVLAALESLGWSEKDAGKAWDRLAADDPEAVASGNVSEVLKAVLASIQRSR